MPKSSYLKIHSIQGQEKINVMYQGVGVQQKGAVTLGYGWGVETIDHALLSVADGSAGTFYARIVVLPVLNLAFAGVTNSGDGHAALDKAIRRFTGLPW